MNQPNRSSYPNSKDAFKNKSSHKSDPFSEAINEFLQEFIVISSFGLWTILRSIFSKYCPLTLASIALTVWVGYYISTEALHIKFVHSIEPSLFTLKRLEVMYKVHRNFYWALISSSLYSPVLLTIGIYMRSLRTKYQAIFNKLGIRNGIGDTPKLLKKKRIDAYRTRYVFDCNGIGLSEFESKKERLEAHFAENIETIKYEKNKSCIELVLNKKDFPTMLTYDEACNEVSLPKSSFLIGHSVDGIISQDISKLPHLLIAGVTGTGKSVFFKQALMGLLESTPHIQMYLVDLKGGLEMIDFSAAPNIKVVKTIDDALKVFRQAEREMKNRFKYLEEKGKKEIIPHRDRKDRIIVGVDEASILYMNRHAHDPDKTKVLEARKLADSITKLSRVAAVHLVLATQKIEASVIPTSVTENVTGRMMFRSNSFQGSNQVLGSKDAMDLPKIDGRGIWNCGPDKVMIQAPYIDSKTIKLKCEKIAEDFKSGKRKCFTPMIGEVESQKNDEKIQAVYDITTSKSDESKQ